MDYIESFHLYLHVAKLLTLFAFSIAAITIAIFYNVIVILAVISHLQSVFTDPGIIPLPSRRHSPSDLLNLKRSVSSGFKYSNFLICAFIPLQHK